MMSYLVIVKIACIVRHLRKSHDTRFVMLFFIDEFRIEIERFIAIQIIVARRYSVSIEERKYRIERKEKHTADFPINI